MELAVKLNSPSGKNSCRLHHVMSSIERAFSTVDCMNHELTYIPNPKELW